MLLNENKKENKKSKKLCWYINTIRACVIGFDFFTRMSWHILSKPLLHMDIGHGDDGQYAKHCQCSGRLVGGLLMKTCVELKLHIWQYCELERITREPEYIGYGGSVRIFKKIGFIHIEIHNKLFFFLEKGIRCVRPLWDDPCYQKMCNVIENTGTTLNVNQIFQYNMCFPYFVAASSWSFCQRL